MPGSKKKKKNPKPRIKSSMLSTVYFLKSINIKHKLSQNFKGETCQAQIAAKLEAYQF